MQVMGLLGTRVRRAPSNWSPENKRIPEPLVVLIGAWMHRQRARIEALMHRIAAGKHALAPLCAPQGARSGPRRCDRPRRRATLRLPTGRGWITQLALETFNYSGGYLRGPERPRDESDGAGLAADGPPLDAAAERARPNPAGLDDAPATPAPAKAGNAPRKQDSRHGRARTGHCVPRHATAPIATGRRVKPGGDGVETRATPDEAGTLERGLGPTFEPPTDRRMTPGYARLLCYDIET